MQYERLWMKISFTWLIIIFATGCRLSAYDIGTGKAVWRADVKQLMVGHSGILQFGLSIAGGRSTGAGSYGSGGAYLKSLTPKPARGSLPSYRRYRSSLSKPTRS